MNGNVIMWIQDEKSTCSGFKIAFLLSVYDSPKKKKKSMLILWRAFSIFLLTNSNCKIRQNYTISKIILSDNLLS